MNYRDEYYRLNWDELAPIGISKEKGVLLIDYDGCNWLKEISCPISVAIIMFIAFHNEVSVIGGHEMFVHFYDDNRGNAFFFDSAMKGLVESEIIKRVE